MLQATDLARAKREQHVVVVRNELLVTMAPPLFERLRPVLQHVVLTRHCVLHHANAPQDMAYFIEEGVVSRIARSPQDGPAEVAMIGRSGMVGVSVLLASPTTPQRTIVQIPGTAFCISAENLRAAMNDEPLIRDHLLRYVQVLMDMKAQIAFCNAKHSIDQRLARWLLLARDRVNGNELPITHQLLAEMLGVRRPGVSVGLSDLEQRGILEKSRSALRILDVERLKAGSCGCYKIITEGFSASRSPKRFEHRLSICAN